MADTNKKEYTSNLHPKGDMDTTVYPNVKSENIIDKDTTAYTAGKVPDSSLVSKSLDGLNEKIETNKIQTETNKTNIAKNTQDIDNLMAVMPTDINVDTNGYAILEHDGTEITGQTKKVKFAQIDKSASFSEVTIPTVSDLKTQDGSTFSGGSKLYNGTEYLPTFDIATLKDTYMDLQSNQTTTDECWKQFSSVKIGYLGGYDRGILIDNHKFYLSYNISNKYTAMTLCNWSLRNMSGVNNTVLLLQNKYNYIKLSSIYGGINYFGIKDKNDNVILSADENTGIILYKGSELVTQATLATDLDAKQDKRFVHTVEIHYASNGSYFCFTGTSDKNTPIDSVEKLTTVFANRDLGGVGVFGSAGLSKIHVGTSVNDTTFKKYMNNGEYANPSEETFATVFNTTGFTITDSVNPL